MQNLDTNKAKDSVSDDAAADSAHAASHDPNEAKDAGNPHQKNSQKNCMWTNRTLDHIVFLTFNCERAYNKRKQHGSLDQTGTIISKFCPAVAISELQVVRRVS
jgi:hypothetical protein